MPTFRCTSCDRRVDSPVVIGAGDCPHCGGDVVYDIHAGGAPDDFRWPFNIPGYWMTPMFTLAVGGVGAGDPAAGVFPARMLVDYIRIW